MAMPKKRMTSARTGARRSHLFLKANNLSLCPQCKQPIMPHRVCPYCGTYKGEQIIRSKYETKVRKKDKNA